MNDSPGTRPLALAALYGFAVLALVLTMAPFAWMLLSSVKPESEILRFPPTWIPVAWISDHYVRLFRSVDFIGNFWNSFVVAVSLSVTTVLVNSMAGFAFAKYRFPGRERLFMLLVAAMMIPGQVTMIPVFLILKSLGLLNTYLGLIIPGTASIFAIFLMRQFMMGIPDALLEAARMDGCSEWRLFVDIVLPLSKPAIATLTIFTFLSSWNEFFGALIVMLEESMYTLPVALANLNGQHGTEWGLLMAGSVVTILPVLLVFLAMQRHYIRGIAMTGVKG